MGRIFDLNNPVMRWIMRLFACMCLSVLWLVVSLPVITAGASTTALFAAIHRYIRLEEGSLWQTFWQAFRENFKRSSLCWLIALAALALLTLDALVFRTMALNGQLLGRLYWLILLLIGILLTWVAYLFCYAERFTGNVKDVLRFSFMLMILHPVKAITVLVTLLAGAALTLLVPGLLVILPAVVCWLCDVVIAGVFAAHLRPEDRQRLEEIQNESEDR